MTLKDIVRNSKKSIKDTSSYEHVSASLGAITGSYLVKTAIDTVSETQKLPIYNFVDNLYNGIDDLVDGITNGAIPDVVSAPIYAAAGAHVVIKGLHWLSKNIVDHIIPDFDQKYLPILETACITTLAVAGTTALILNPQIWTENPVYVTGMVSSGVSALATAGKDVHDKKYRGRVQT